MIQERDRVMIKPAKRGIETRPVFYPMNILLPYRRHAKGQRFPVAERVGARGINLPTWAGLKEEDVEFVFDASKKCVK